MRPPELTSQNALFIDRAQAGCELARKIEARLAKRRVGGVAPARMPIAVGLVPGGIPVAFEVARRLKLPLDAFVVRRVVSPLQSSVKVGAASEAGECYVDDGLAHASGLTDADLALLCSGEVREARHLAHRFRGLRLPLPVTGRTVYLIDDGQAPGALLVTAVRALRKRGAERVVFGAPLLTDTVRALLEAAADEVICVKSVGADVTSWYAHDTLEDTDVLIGLLDRARSLIPAESLREAQELRGISSEIVTIGNLRAELSVPDEARGLVVVAHDGRLEPDALERERRSTAILHGVRLATLLVGGASDDSKTLLEAVRLVARRMPGLPVALAASGTLVRAAIGAATGLGAELQALVLRGCASRTLALEAMAFTGPTLLLTGEVERAEVGARVEHEMIPGAVAELVEPGALEAATHLAADWLVACFSHSSHRALSRAFV